MKTIAIILGAVLFVLTATQVAKQFHRADLEAKQSAQMALLAEARILLDDYHAKSGKYPGQIKVLRFTYPDGGNPSLLNDFTYESTDDCYSLSTVGYYSGQTFEIKRKIRATEAR